MLVLTRKLNEEIIIDGQITIRLLRVNGNRIRLGIEAPADVSVKRAELWDKLAGEGPSEVDPTANDGLRVGAA